MADQQQLELLRQGVTAWNTSRQQHPDIYANLREADLSGADLSGADLYRADLREADLREADLYRADLSGAYLSGAYLSGANLREAHLDGANLSEADLSRAHLREAHLGGAHLYRADLSGADLSGAYLYSADLSSADLSSADLSSTDLSVANLSSTDLSSADLSGARVGWTIFGIVDLRMVKGLDTLVHHHPSTIGADTLMRSEGNIPETFLRGAGLSDTFITYVRSLTQNPIEYYTCFISYSSHDQEFVERLYADLQSKGVRCWFAPEDLKTGDKIRHRIDESIRLYDKLLLVLSKHSITSTWVEHEVEMALAKEQKGKRTILFPIRLDRAIIDMEQDGWPAEVRQTRHITNFEQWKEHDAYQKSLKRLLRDLQPDHPPTSKP